MNKKINIFPGKITLKLGQNKRGWAFLEFSSHEKAEEILNSFNGKRIDNFILKLNWIKPSEKSPFPQIKKFKVNQ